MVIVRDKSTLLRRYDCLFTGSNLQLGYYKFKMNTHYFIPPQQEYNKICGRDFGFTTRTRIASFIF